MYLWSFAVAAALGAICALQLRALFFTAMVFVAVCALGIIRHFLGDRFFDILIWAVLYEFSFALGFVVAVVCRYLWANSKRGRRSNEEEANNAKLLVPKGPNQESGDSI